MSPDTLFIIIIAIIIFSQIFDYTLDYLNLTYRNKPIPKELNDIYDNEQYRKQQAYEEETTRFSFWSSLINFCAILIVLFTDSFALLDNYLRIYISHEIWLSLSFFAILMFLSSIISFPFSLYSTFVIEEKYGFNNTTLKIFLLDKFKGALLTVVIGGGLLYLVIFLYQIFGTYFWIYTWLIITFIMLIMNMFYSQLIVPLFNKQIPLEEGSLRNAIEEFSQKVGFKLNNIFVIDGSKRSTKANAYFSGLGPKKRIVLYDTLINDLSEKEIVAVLAHEVGHYKHKHTIKGMLMAIVQTGIILFVFSLLIANPILNQALGSNHQSFHFGLIVFSFLLEPISQFIGVFMNVFSRKNEYQADAFAQNYGFGESLISALKKLSGSSLSNLTPHPFYVFIHYSHPSLYQRIKTILTRNISE